jgi:eukaryotic-like serine/threonine-protein kinase
LSISIGSKLGSIEVLSTIGRGGMGEVYRARDTRLGRDVAIKILPDEFSRDPDRLARFQREAEVLASLNHPNIAAIHSLEEVQDARFLVLELVEGETLAERISRGRLPVDEALHIAKGICEALEAAHEKGIVHRDLKPANVKITPEGNVKVLDFGLAKAYEPQPGNHALSNSPTMGSMVAATSVGVILGTAAYMSPEQAKGRSVDRRSDIFAFAAVLYEMLLGRPAFEGEDLTEILGRVVTADPDWSRLPANTPAVIHKLLRRGLKKDPRQRLGDIRDARLDIEEALMEPATTTTPVTRAVRHPRLAWIIAAAAMLIATGLAIPAMRHVSEPTPAEMRVDINTPPAGASAYATYLALSPDGSRIAFVADAGGTTKLWLRALNRTEAQPMEGTDGAALPFWSPDGRSIGFFNFQLAKLYRIDVGGGPPTVLADAPRGSGGAWSPDGTILFSPAANTPLWRVAASGGEAVPLTKLDPPRQTSHRFPTFLQDGRHFLFYATGSADESGIYLASLDGTEAKRVSPADTAAAYIPPDWVLFVRQTSLVARRLDLARGELLGDTATLANLVAFDRGLAQGLFSVSGTGRIAYRSTVGVTQKQLTWFDRTGKALGVAGEPDSNSVGYPQLSADGRRLAITRAVQNNGDIWLLDLARSGLSRLTFDEALDSYALWSPDATHIVFSSQRKGGITNFYMKSSAGSGADELLFENPNVKIPQDWSSDGRFLLYYEVQPKTGRDLWVLDMTTKELKPRVVANTPFEEKEAQFSPDGRWVAYETNESGRFQIVVQSFPDVSGKWQVSTAGGTQPRWRADGKELYFIAPDSKLMAVPVNGSSAAFEAGTPVALFQTRISGGGALPPNRPQYAVSRDGRFLINQDIEDSATSPITLILNWQPPGK